MKRTKDFLKEHWMELLVALILIISIIVSACSQGRQNGAWIWTLLNNVNIIVGFITAIIAYGTWRTTRMLRGNYEREARIAQNSTTDNSIALIISCGEDKAGKIKSNVENFLNKEDSSKTSYKKLLMGDELIYANALQDKYKNKYKIHVKNHCIFLEMPSMPEEEGTVGTFMEQYSTVLQDISGLCGVNNISSIYLFIGGPMPVAFLAGERFANNYTVYTHHYVNGSYIMTTNKSFREYVDKSKLFEF